MFAQLVDGHWNIEIWAFSNSIFPRSDCFHMYIDAPPDSTTTHVGSESQNLINETIAFWSRKGVQMTHEQARCAMKSVKDLYVLFDKWDRDKQQSQFGERVL